MKTLAELFVIIADKQALSYSNISLVQVDSGRFFAPRVRFCFEPPLWNAII